MEVKMDNGILGQNCRVVGYARSSAAANSLEVQKRSYEQACARNSWINLALISETGPGISIQRRPGIQKLLRLIDEGGVDAVWVADPSRLARAFSLPDFAEILMVFLRYQVTLITPDRSWDFKDEDVLVSFHNHSLFDIYKRRERMKKRKESGVQ
jgi:DNA invertase Pin-like site-specific DNA recombinase